MRKILISIKPKWTAKILNGEKTIEVRKTAPKCELPCEVYIYCTNGRDVIKPSKTNPKFRYIKSYSPKKGCVVAKFTLNKIDEIENDRLWETDKYFLERTCLSFGELACYLNGKTGYAWHIDNLVIFDKPKELGYFIEFGTPTYEQTKPFAEAFGKPHSKEEYRKQCERFGYTLKRPPQSWCYVEVDE